MKTILSPSAGAVVLLALWPAMTAPLCAAEELLHLNARSRTEIAPRAGRYEVIERPLEWDPARTAVIVIDVWDKHWCEGANRRVGKMVQRMNALVQAMRDRGALIVHAPSDTMATYEGTPQRKLAQAAPAAPAPQGIEFKWNYLNADAEGTLPIDDSDGGCDCEPQQKSEIVWKGQHPDIQIEDGDAISDKGDEIYNLLQSRGIDNVMILGVHTNMCILGRPFGIRMMTRLGKNVVLVRDLTDTMYNPRMAPFVPHDKGTDLVVEHVEKYWCPTIKSADILGDHKQPHVVLISAEQEYGAKETLADFARADLEKRGFRCTLINSDSTTDIPGLDALNDADLLVLYMRRRELPAEQLAMFKKWFEAGKPVVAIRTSSHAFQNWLEFDKLVLGGNYQGHHGNDSRPTVTAASNAEADPLLRGVELPFQTEGSLYRASPLAETARPLLTGIWKDAPTEPVAWTNTHNAGRVFYTSLGHKEDFKTASFRRLLLNGVLWALDKPILDDDK